VVTENVIVDVDRVTRSATPGRSRGDALFCYSSPQLIQRIQLTMHISEECAQRILDRALMDRLSWACLEERAAPGGSRDKLHMWKQAIACDLVSSASCI
jgi:hypothetical protein